jgi:hypothetical protein
MVVCPIALVAGCRKCPAFSMCPLKGVIGDYKPEASPPAHAVAAPVTRSPKVKARSKRARTRRSRKR